MKVFLCLIGALVCGLAPANAQDRGGEPHVSIKIPAMCVAAHLKEYYAEGPNCPEPERFLKILGHHMQSAVLPYT